MARRSTHDPLGVMANTRALRYVVLAAIHAVLQHYALMFYVAAEVREGFQGPDLASKVMKVVFWLVATPIGWLAPLILQNNPRFDFRLFFALFFMNGLFWCGVVAFLRRSRIRSVRS